MTLKYALERFMMIRVSGQRRPVNRVFLNCSPWKKMLFGPRCMQYHRWPVEASSGVTIPSSHKTSMTPTHWSNAVL